MNEPLICEQPVPRYKLHPLLTPIKPPEKAPTRVNYLQDEQMKLVEERCFCGCGELALAGRRVKGYRKDCYMRLRRAGKL